MYKQSKMIRNLLYFSKFNKDKTIFYHLQVTLVPVHFMMHIARTLELMYRIHLAVHFGGATRGGGRMPRRQLVLLQKYKNIPTYNISQYF